MRVLYNYFLVILTRPQLTDLVVRVGHNVNRDKNVSALRFLCASSPVSCTSVRHMLCRTGLRACEGVVLMIKQASKRERRTDGMWVRL